MLQLTRQPVFMMTFFVYSSCMLHREASALVNDIPEESGHFRFLHSDCLGNIKGSVGFILAKTSVMRISIPLDLSSSRFIPPPCFIRSRRPTTLLPPSLVFSPCVLPKRHMKGSYLRVLPDFLTLHSFSVTFLPLETECVETDGN